MSRFAPVHLERSLDHRASQTFLRHFNSCPRSAYFYARDKGEAQNVAMVRGSAIHAVYERATNTMIEQGEPTLPPELAKAIVNEVLAEYPVPVEEHDYVRESAYRWASEWAIDPSAVIACETLFALEIDGWEVRAKVDFAELREGGASVYVGDYKSGRGAPAYDDVARKRSDGTMAAKNFQLILYALALVYGRPVRVEERRTPCDKCNAGLSLLSVPGTPVRCSMCDGTGERAERIEITEPFPLAGRAQEVIGEFVFPGIEDSEGRMLRRTMGLTRLELEEYRESLSTLLARVDAAERTGDWPAVVSDAGCGECPCPSACPIPAELRDHRGTINDHDQAAETMERLYVRKKRDEATRREIKAWAKANGGRVRFGKDRVIEFADLQERETIDKDALWPAVEAAVNLGRPFERSDFVKISRTTPFAERTLGEDELAEEAAQQRQEDE